MKEMKFEVAFMPSDVTENSPSVCVLIDVIRASTTITKLLEKGCSEIVLTKDEQETMTKNPLYTAEDTLICAEKKSGDTEEGADFSPSLMAVEEADVRNKRVVMRTMNGTVGVYALQDRNIKHIFIGCLNNAEAVMKESVKLAAELNTGVMIVSAGRESTKIAAVDDAYCAAQLLSAGIRSAIEKGISPVVADSGMIANSLLESYTDAYDAFSQSASGEVMRRISCEEDIFTCAQSNTTDVVGKVLVKEDQLIVQRTEVQQLVLEGI